MTLSVVWCCFPRSLFWLLKEKCSTFRLLVETVVSPRLNYYLPLTPHGVQSVKKIHVLRRNLVVNIDRNVLVRNLFMDLNYKS